MLILVKKTNLFSGSPSPQPLTTVTVHRMIFAVKHSLPFLSIPIIIIVVWWLPGPLTALADFEQDVWPYFEKHCVECHDDTTTKGGLDLYSAVSSTIAGKSAADQWTTIFDRVDHGEMPPKKQARPAAGETVVELRKLCHCFR